MVLEVKVKPGTGKDKILIFKEPNILEVSLKAKPEKGEANKSLCRFLSKILKVNKEDVKIIKGKKERKKVLKIDNFSEDKFISRIKEYLEKGR